jgi:WD40 repeat protein
VSRASETREAGSRQLARAAQQGLVVRSAALVRRGLRDLARESHWLVKKVFEGPVSNAAVSPDGQVCTFSAHVRTGTQRLTLFDVERSVPTMTLTMPDEPVRCEPGLASTFAWSPDARHLIAAWAAWPAALQLFDLEGKRHLGAFGNFSRIPSDMAWSADGRSLVVSSNLAGPQLQLWNMRAELNGQFALPLAPERRLGEPDWIERQGVGTDSSKTGTFFAFGKTALRPGRPTIATVLEIEGDWADDSILLADAATFERRAVFAAQGHVTDLAWSHDGARLIYCSAGQAYAVQRAAGQAASLPFGAEMCAWHPHLPICLFFSAWLKNSAKGRLFLVDMNRMVVFDEYPAEGVLDLCWSDDGSKAYAANSDGLVYLYEPELL